MIYPFQQFVQEVIEWPNIISLISKIILFNNYLLWRMNGDFTVSNQSIQQKWNKCKYFRRRACISYYFMSKQWIFIHSGFSFLPFIAKILKKVFFFQINSFSLLTQLTYWNWAFTTNRLPKCHLSYSLYAHF